MATQGQSAHRAHPYAGTIHDDDVLRISTTVPYPARLTSKHDENMKKLAFTLALALSAVASLAPAAVKEAKFHPGNYMLVYIGVTNANYRKAFASIADNPAILGVQKRYSWTDLEPTKGKYDFSEIERDLDYLQSIGKRLVIEVRDTGKELPVPSYMRTPEYSGGYFKGAASKQFMAQRWNPAVVERFSALLAALGKRFDHEPFLEAINFDETATGMRPFQYAKSGYTPEKMRDGVKAIMSAAKAAFPNTVVIQYINFLPGKVAYLADIAEHAYQIGVGLGGPDILIDKDLPSYQYFRRYAGKIPLGAAVQTFSWQLRRPDGSRVNAQDLLEAARDRLHLDYIFWLRKSPEFTADLLPMLRASNHQASEPINKN